MSHSRPPNILLLGSTGSIGTSTLSVLERYPELGTLYGLVAHRNVESLAAQSRKWRPQVVCLTTSEELPAVPDTWMRGMARAGELAARPEVDIVVAAMVGVDGVFPVYEALKAGKTVLLANKESLVAAGALLTETAAQYGGKLIPVDSEHAALFQLLEPVASRDVLKVFLTASGGSLRKTPLENLSRVTPQEALAHPTWVMGPKITIDSATLVNKALEVIEAKWLFNLEPHQIEAVIHPQSIVHGMVELCDGTLLAHLSTADMQGPIAWALGYPTSRMSSAVKGLDLLKVGALSFEGIEEDRFPAFFLGLQALHEGGAMPLVFTKANDCAVEQFLKEKISFLEIPRLIEKALNQFRSATISSMTEVKVLCDEVSRFLL